MRSPPQFPAGGILGGHPAVRANDARSAMAEGILRQYTDWGPRSSLQQAAANPSDLGRLGGLSSAHPASFFNPTTSLPVPPPQASWGVPQLSPLPTEFGGESFNARQATDDSAVLSDADPDAWIPNGQYANRNTRRGGRRTGERELAPAEEIRWTIYNHHLGVLGNLEPQNRLLTSIHDGRWVPSQRDLQRIEEEIARARREQAAWTLERQHNLPRQFQQRFNASGLDPEDFVTYMSRELHRLKPYGWHTGPNNWNSVWRRFFGEQQTKAEAEETQEILRQLLKMWMTVPWKKP